jgi:hypothetical protein
LLAKLAPRAPRRILEELVARGQKAAVTGKDRPVVTLLLTTGRDVTGRAVAIADDGGLAVIALHVGGPISAPQVTHVRVDQIVAVTHDVTTPRPPMADEPAPGRLELTRALAPHAAHLSSRIDHKLALVPNEPMDDDDRRAVMATISLFAQVLGKLADDPMGTEALRHLSEIRLGAAAKGDVRTAGGGVLVVEVPRSSDDAWDERALKNAIEKAL